jgi:MYXO-CTERM domain-containing protein
MKSLATPALVLAVLCSLALPASAQVNISEGPDFSNFSPGSPIALANGVNTIAGSVATPVDYQDNFQITIPAGGQLTAASVTLNTGGGFVGGAVFNLADVRNSSGSFSMGFPFGPGTYSVQVYADFAIGNAWSFSFSVTGVAPVCGNGIPETGEACDDGNTTQCDGCSSTCTTVPNGCLIGGTCIAEGAPEPGNTCRACLRTVSRTAYSPVTVGTACNDGLFCTAVDSCNGTGSCGGTTRNCGDALGCTTDACDETANACTNVLSTGCLIGGACVAESTADPSNACMACVPSTSTSAYSATAAGSSCDDGAFCTVDDACDGSGLCGGDARTCADDDACTTDGCDDTADMCSFTAILGCMADAGIDDAGIDDDAGIADDDAGIADDDVGIADDDAGIADGGGSDGGMRDAGGSGGDVDPVPASDGCSCRAGARRGPSGLLFAMAAFGLALAMRRRAR